MKKLVVLVTMLLTLAFAGTCLASENGNALNKADRAIASVLTAFGADVTDGYASASAGFATALKEKVNAEAFAKLKEQVTDKFGRMKESKMVAFERFDQADRVTYLAGYSKEKVVRIVFLFDKDTKLVDFGFAPMQVQQPAAETPAK